MLARLMLFTAALTVCSLHAVADSLIWQIGAKDDSFAEFAIPGRVDDYASTFPSGVGYGVGKDAPSTGWPFIQPGPVDAWGGSRRHPRRIEFSLDPQPDAVYVLEIDFVDTHGTHPATVEARLNGTTRTYRLERGTGDPSISDPAKGREQVMRVYVRGRALRAGRNVVTLTLTRGSWVLYDCITFAECSSPPKTVENLRLSPTFMFRKSGNRLMQVVDVSMNLLEEHRAVEAELVSGEALRVRQTFEHVPAGRVSLKMDVPEVAEPIKASVRVRIGQETFEADGSIVPQKKWLIYLMPSSHLDIGYTALQPATMRVHRDNLDRAMDWCPKYSGFVWELEGSLVFEDYLRNGPRPETLIDLAKQGRVSVQGFYGNELTGICSHEELARLCDYYDYLRNTYGIESRCAMMSDVPTMVGTVPMILAGHGIRYLSHGVNATRARGDQELYNTPHYWESPDGSRVLTWRVPGYGYASQITGGDADTTMEAAEEAVNGILTGYSRRADYPYDAILMHGGYSDNQPNYESLARIPDEWNRAYEYPKLIFARGPEFFEHIERNFAQHIPTMKGDQGVWWEDGAGSSAFETAITREAKEQLVTAEKLIALCGVEFQKQMAPRLAEAWENVLYYDEHTWGAAQSISHPDSKATREQWAYKKRFADDAARQARKVLKEASEQFGREAKPAESGVMVFNPSSWPRTEWVTYKDRIGLEKQVLAENVPPMGWKLLPNPEKQVQPEEQSGDTLENRFYTIRFDKATGAVASIYDKELQRELVDSSQYGLNQFVYASGGENNRVLNCDLGKPIPDLTKHFCSGTVLKKQSLPGRQVMVITSTAPMASSFSTEVTLHNGIKRVDFVNRIDKNPTTAKEAGYFAFPFALKTPEMRIEIPNGVIRPDTDQVKAACRDWYCAQHFVTVSDDSAAVVWSPAGTPLLTLQDIFRGQWYDRLPIENGHVFAYAFNSYWFTNYKASQQGPMTFRFAITSAAKVTDAEAKRFGESVQSPMIAIPLSVSPAPEPASKSYVTIDSENVVLQAMAPARFADGTMIRLREMSGKTGTVKLTTNGVGFRTAYLCNLAEDKIEKLPVTGGSFEVPCRALGLTTVVLER